ncbi:MAG: 8-oxo-dGTP diphosphatase / 2-hydroxy-dATP diphosphatase [Patescibacteria group bacterium]|jgi:8-oxo-dGTP pyrophosphatase MutT (NUDIX family)|nr:8-oxo-dGTP diphosphatase / 2-hydroxy-dATP diphosphatase [Patescibacteria group bacterium]
MKKIIGTVCFIVHGKRVMLAEIIYPDGKRFWNGLGGVVDDGESPKNAVVREISEETKIAVRESDVTEVKIINVGNLELHIFATSRYSGELQVLDPTLKQLQWFDFDSVPYSQMHIGNDSWLPGVLKTFASGMD